MKKLKASDNNKKCAKFNKRNNRFSYFFKINAHKKPSDSISPSFLN